MAPCDDIADIAGAEEYAEITQEVGVELALSAGDARLNAFPSEAVDVGGGKASAVRVFL